MPQVITNNLANVPVLQTTPKRITCVGVFRRYTVPQMLHKVMISKGHAYIKHSNLVQQKNRTKNQPSACKFIIAIKEIKYTLKERQGNKNNILASSQHTLRSFFFFF